MKTLIAIAVRSFFRSIGWQIGRILTGQGK